MNIDDKNIDNRNHSDWAEPGVVAFTGHQVIDERGERIGQITDVLYDDPNAGDIGDPSISSQPTWVVVDPGLLRAAHYVPVAGSYRSVDVDIVVPWDKAWIKSAPKARGDHQLSRVDIQDLAQHYATV